MDAVRGFVLAVAAGVVLLVLGRPVGADVPPDETPFAQTTDTAGIAGTVWEGVDSPQQWHMIYRFEKGGVLIYSNNGCMHHDGKWKQDGATVYFEIFLKCHQCQGAVHGDRFEGDSWSQGGAKWKTVLRASR